MRNKLKITPDFLETCIWMSYRYSCGSHTIATHMHAADIAECLRDNPDFLSPGRRQFMGRDIKSEIGNRLHYYDNIHVDGFQEHHDALTLLIEHCIEHNIKPSEIFRYDFHINTRQGTCAHERSKNKDKDDGLAAHRLMDIEDLMVWVKLAGYLDPTEHITWCFDGKTDSADGFAYFCIDRHTDEFGKCHVTCEKYVKSPHFDIYITDDYITKIEQI